MITNMALYVDKLSHWFDLNKLFLAYIDIITLLKKGLIMRSQLRNRY